MAKSTREMLEKVGEKAAEINQPNVGKEKKTRPEPIKITGKRVSVDSDASAGSSSGMKRSPRLQEPLSPREEEARERRLSDSIIRRKSGSLSSGSLLGGGSLNIKLTRTLSSDLPPIKKPEEKTNNDAKPSASM